jgi:hypothetical protein
VSQPGDPAAAGQHEHQRADGRHAGGARWGAEGRVQERQPLGEGALGREPHQQTLQVDKGDVRGRQQQEQRRDYHDDRRDILQPERRRQVADHPDQRRIGPDRFFSRRYQAHEQECARHCHRQREQQHQQAHPPQSLDARRLEFVRVARQRIAAADCRQRQGEPGEIRQHTVHQRCARRIGEGGRPNRRRRSQRPQHADQRPAQRQHQDADADPDALRGPLRRDLPTHARAGPERTNQHRRDQGREVAGQQPADVTALDRHRHQAGDVLADDEARQGGEGRTLDQRRRGAEVPDPLPECRLEAAHRTTRNEQSPALDVDGADEGREQRRGEHEPHRLIPDLEAGDAGDEERRAAQLRHREGGGPRHRHRWQQRHRREDDAERASRPDRQSESHCRKRVWAD